MKKAFILTIIILFTSSQVNADVGPKRSVDLEVSYNNKPITDEVFYAKLLECPKELYWDDPRCDFDGEICSEFKSVSIPDPEKGCNWSLSEIVWGGECTNSRCEFSYWIPHEFRVVLYLPSKDKTYVSDAASLRTFNNRFLMNIRADGTADIVPFEANKMVLFFIALGITLALESIVALFFCSVAKIKKRIVLYAIAGSIITLPFVWFVFPLFFAGMRMYLYAEFFAVVFEAYFIHFLNKNEISLRKSLLLSVLMNITSFFLGGIIFVFAYSMFW
jgi:hypothetical protein